MKSPIAAVSASLALLLALWTVEAVERPYVPAIYVFGDSLADVGNNNHLPGSIDGKANFPHNGIDFPGGKPTGRFSNGYNAIDFLAKLMGFKESPPPVLSIKKPRGELIRGVSYASGGSGILDATNRNTSLPLSTQVGYFRRSVRWLAHAKGKTEAARILSKSIFVFTTASNDLFGFFATSGPQTNGTQKDKFISLLATQYAEQLKGTYGLGARKFAVFGTSLLGCPPALRALKPTGGCIEDLNDLSRRFNVAMKEKLQRLSLASRGMKYAYFKTDELVKTILADPLKFGFKEVNSACCGSGRFNGVSRCLPNVTVCARRSEYLSWDRLHPSQAMYKLAAEFAFSGTRKFVAPVNIKILASS